MRSLSPHQLLFSLLILAGVAASLPGVAFGASKPPAECATVLNGETPPDALARTLESEYLASPGNPKPLWQAATARRCSLLATAEPQARCLIGGEAKSLYDKFSQTAQGLGQSGSFKKELGDTRKYAGLLASELSLTCVEQAKVARQQKQFGLAAQLFEAAYVLTYKPNQLYNAARSCEDGELWMEAEVYFTAYLSLDAAWRDRRDAVKKLVDIQRRLASDTGGQVAAARQAAERAEMMAKTAQGQSARAESQVQSAVSQAQTAARNAADATSVALSARQRAESADAKSNNAQQYAQQAHQTAGEASRTAQDASRRASAADQQAKTADQRATDARTAVLTLNGRMQAVEREVYELRTLLSPRISPPPMEP